MPDGIQSPRSATVPSSDPAQRRVPEQDGTCLPPTRALQQAMPMTVLRESSRAARSTYSRDLLGVCIRGWSRRMRNCQRDNYVDFKVGDAAQMIAELPVRLDLVLAHGGNHHR